MMRLSLDGGTTSRDRGKLPGSVVILRRTGKVRLDPGVRKVLHAIQDFYSHSN